MENSHRALRLYVWPHRPLSGKYRLLPLLAEGWPGLTERHGALRRDRMRAVQKRGRWWWRGAPLLKQVMAWKSWISYKKGISLLRRWRREWWWRWWRPPPLVLDWQPWGLREVGRNGSRRMLLKVWRNRKSLGSYGRSWLGWNWQQGHLYRRHYRPLEMWVYVYVLRLLRCHWWWSHHYSRCFYLRGHM